jgi:hypothetical protein
MKKTLCIVGPYDLNLPQGMVRVKADTPLLFGLTSWFAFCHKANNQRPMTVKIRGDDGVRANLHRGRGFF